MNVMILHVYAQMIWFEVAEGKKDEKPRRKSYCF